MHYKHLSIEERELIQQGLWEKRSVRSIASDLGRSPASVCREIRRNLPPERFLYTPRLAHEQALAKRKSRGRKERLKNERVRQYVIFRLKRRWSPEQIAARIRVDLGETVSHEAVYQLRVRTNPPRRMGIPETRPRGLAPVPQEKAKAKDEKGFKKMPEAIQVKTNPWRYFQKH